MRIWSKNLIVASRLLCTRYNTRLYSSSVVNEEGIAKVLMNGHPKNNLVESIVSKVGRNLHLIENHPLGIIKNR